MKSLYDCFMDRDCDMVEINPLITTKEGKVMAADSKVTIDSNSFMKLNYWFLNMFEKI